MSDDQMNSVILTSNGHVGFGQIPKLTKSSLKPGQMLVKVEAAALNPSDVLFMRGLYKGKINYPYTPGWEGSGTVVAVAPGSGILAKALDGRRVAFNKMPEVGGTWLVGGALAEYIIVDPNCIIPLSEEYSFEEGATFFVNPLTALCMVERVKALGSKVCIVTAAASQIGRMLISLLLANGILPICTVRREEQAELLKMALGPKIGKFVVNTSSPDYMKTMTEICKTKRPSTCLECISGEVPGHLLEFMGFESTLIIYGLLSDQKLGGINTLSFLGKNQRMEAFLLWPYMNVKSFAQKIELMLQAESLYKTALKTSINKTLGFHQIAEGIDLYLRNQSAGKIIFKPSLTKKGEAPTTPVHVNGIVAKL